MFKKKIDVNIILTKIKRFTYIVRVYHSMKYTGLKINMQYLYLNDFYAGLI